MSNIIVKHLTIKQLKETLKDVPDDYVICMTAPTELGYVVAGQYYNIDPMSKAVFLIDVTSQPTENDKKFKE